MKRTNLGWAWNPDPKTESAIKTGNRKVRGLPLGSDKPHYGGLIETKPTHMEKTHMATKTTSKKKTVAPTSAKETSGIPLKKICAELKIEPRLARRKLRNADLSFHDSRERWVFSPANAKRVKEILQPAA